MRSEGIQMVLAMLVGYILESCSAQERADVVALISYPHWKGTISRTSKETSIN